MSQPDRLFRRIHEYYDLLGFLFEEYPNILDEWKSKGTGPGTIGPNTNRTDDADVNNPGERNDYKTR